MNAVAQLVISEVDVKCGSCGKRTEGDFAICLTCDAKFCGDCSQCDCDRIKEVVEDLTAIANRSGAHAQLLAHLRVTRAGLRKLEAAA